MATFQYEKVEQRIMGLIGQGMVKPGEKLPSIRSLGRSMGMSMTTVIQAYGELEKKGIIQSRERSGFFVHPELSTLGRPQLESRFNTSPTLVNLSGRIQTVLDMVGRREVLPFGVACPSEQVLPGKKLATIMGRICREHPARTMEYETITGAFELRTELAMRCLENGIKAGPDSLIITSGALEGISIALRALTRPGDNVLVQSPTYYCFLQLLEVLKLRAIEVPSCPEDGINPKDVSKALSRFNISAAVLCPTYNNPDGSLTPEAAKKEITSMLAGRGIPLIEDDVYGEVSFTSPRPRTCKSFDRDDNVVLCSSFSKTLAPGYRVGWIMPGKYFDKCLEVKATTNVCTATPPQLALAQALKSGVYDQHMKKYLKVVAGQMQAIRYAVGKYFPEGTRATSPSGGLALWLELEKDVHARDVFERALKKGVGIVPGFLFSPSDRFKNFIRLTVTGRWDDEMENGIKVLGDIVKEIS